MQYDVAVRITSVEFVEGIGEGKPTNNSDYGSDFAEGQRQAPAECDDFSDYARGMRTLPRDLPAGPDYARGLRTLPMNLGTHPSYARGMEQDAAW
jgi:hypothetical protein